MSQTVSERLRLAIRDVPDFPKPGIVFKDVTPVLKDPLLSGDILEALTEHWKSDDVEGVIGIESRGFIFGMQMAMRLGVPFIPVRKAGKLPYNTLKHSYDLEYGSAEVEIHTDAIEAGQKILIHDDLLATGGTAGAAAELVGKSGGEVAGFSFLIALTFLNGHEILSSYHSKSVSLVSY